MKKKYLLFLVIFLLIGAIFSFINSPFFQVRTFSIQGNNVLKEEELDKYLNDYENNNILFLDKSSVEKRLKEQENYIKNINVVKKYPNKLEIRIEERKALAKIVNDGITFVIDKEGYILENNKNKLKSKVPLIEGLGYSFKKDKIIYTNKLENIINSLNKVNYTLLTKINLIEYNYDESNSTDEILMETSNDIEIFLGNFDNLNKKMSILEAVIEKTNEENINIDYLNLKYPEKPVYK
ncbi:MAG: cell division protein FtsQ/DivIB [Bacillota bacterium]